jgi:hypothetical protein
MEMALVGGAFGLLPVLLASLHLPTGFSGLRGFVERGVPFLFFFLSGINLHEGAWCISSIEHDMHL